MAVELNHRMILISLTLQNGIAHLRFGLCFASMPGKHLSFSGLSLSTGYMKRNVCTCVHTSPNALPADRPPLCLLAIFQNSMISSTYEKQTIITFLVNWPVDC